MIVTLEHPQRDPLLEKNHRHDASATCIDYVISARESQEPPDEPPLRVVPDTGSLQRWARQLRELGDFQQAEFVEGLIDQEWGLA